MPTKVNNNNTALDPATPDYDVSTEEDSEGYKVQRIVTRPSKIAYTHSKITVTSTNAEILASNTARAGGWLQNNSNDTTIFLKFGDVAVINEGIELGPKASLPLAQNGLVTTQQVQAVTTSGTADILITTGTYA